MGQKSPRNKKNDVFENEQKTLKKAEEIASSEFDPETIAQEYQELYHEYAQLLGDARLVTSVSDRLQNKINRTNEKLNQANERISAQNEQLKGTIQQLKEARVGRKATTIVLLLAVVLFLISEAFIEPQIEKYVNDWYIGLVFKGLIALLLKPIENVVEKILIRKENNMMTNL